MQVLLYSGQCALLLSKNVLLFLELPFCFPELPFHFPEALVCFPKVPFCFSKMPYCFPELLFRFPEVPSIYLLCTSFFKNPFFCSWLCLLVLLRAAQRDNIYLFFFCFFLGALYWPTYNTFLVTWKPPREVLIFYVFYSNSSLNDSLENVVS